MILKLQIETYLYMNKAVNSPIKYLLKLFFSDQTFTTPCCCWPSKRKAPSTIVSTQGIGQEFKAHTHE